MKYGESTFDIPDQGRVGGNFLKRKTAKEVIAESFREVAERKNINKITVKDITDNCG